MVECTGLENRQGPRVPREFESHPLRHVVFGKQQDGGAPGFWRVGRVVECGGLENRCRRKMTGGSNPPLSEYKTVWGEFYSLRHKFFAAQIIFKKT